MITSTRVQTPSRFRRLVLDRVDPAAQPLPTTIKKLYVWPTADCSIGCRHCNYASPKKSTDPTRRAIADNVDTIIEFALASGAANVTFCGGGEPLDEPDALLHVVDALAPTDIGFGLYTSGHSNRYDLDVDGLVADLARRWTAGGGGDFRIRLSVDFYHHERIGAAPVAAWLRAVDRYAPWMAADIRATQLVGDDSLTAVADDLKATIVPLGARSARLVMPSGRVVSVKSKPLVLDGRISLDRLHRDGLALPDAQRQRVATASVRGGRRVGRVLSNRLPVTTKRLDYEIRADGECRVLEVGIPDNVKYVFSDDWPTIRDANLADPIVHLVAAGGMTALGNRVQLAVGHGLVVDAPHYSSKALRSSAAADIVTATAVAELARTAPHRYSTEVRAEADAVLAGLAGTATRWFDALGEGLT